MEKDRATKNKTSNFCRSQQTHISIEIKWKFTKHAMQWNNNKWLNNRLYRRRIHFMKMVRRPFPLATSAATMTETTTTQHNHKIIILSFAHFDGAPHRHTQRNRWSINRSKYLYFLLCFVCGFCTCPWMDSRTHDLYVQPSRTFTFRFCIHTQRSRRAPSPRTESALHTADTLMSATVWRTYVFAVVARVSFADEWTTGWMDGERENGRGRFFMTKIEIA